jgi:hypothetical protein
MSKLRGKTKTDARVERRQLVWASVSNSDRKHDHHKPGSQNPHKQGSPHTRR